MYRKIHVKAKVIHLFHRLALLYVKLYFCLMRWIFLGLYCLLFLCVRHWESVDTALYSARSNTMYRVFLINVIWKWQQKQCWRLKHISKDNKVWKSLTVKPLLWCLCVHRVCEPWGLQHTSQGEPALLVLCSLQSCLMQVGNFYSQKNFQLTCKVLTKFLFVILSWTSLFWEVGCAVWVTVLHRPSEWVYYKRF